MPTSNKTDMQHDIDAIRADLSNLMDAISRLSQDGDDIREFAKKRFGKTARRASRASGQLFADMLEAGEDGVDAVGRGLNSAISDIARNPITAMVAALGVGLLLGIIGSRR